MREHVECYFWPDAERYGLLDFVERDNFPTLETALSYVRHLRGTYPRTPYSVLSRGRRFRVMYVPEWKLR